MRLNTIKPSDGSKKEVRRVGRGIGSGFGKTAGRGHKGQRRLPKRGFRSMSKPYNAKVRTSELNKLDNGVVDLLSLKAANLIPNISLNAKIFLSGEVTKKLIIQGISMTKGALKAVKDAGGKVEEVAAENPTAEKKDLVKDKPAKKSK